MIDLGPSRVPGAQSEPGEPVALGPDQLRDLSKFAAGHTGTVLVRDESDGYVGAYLLDAYGAVTDEKLLFPVGPS